MAEEFIPCWRINRFSPGRKSFAFIDTAEYHADQLFINEGIQVKFKEEFIHPDSKYRLIFCNCLKIFMLRSWDLLLQEPCLPRCLRILQNS